MCYQLSITAHAMLITSVGTRPIWRHSTEKLTKSSERIGISQHALTVTGYECPWMNANSHK